MIRLLPESIIRSIAAGEVIERPSSVVRELLENAIDAQATSIELSLVEGGIKRICLRDNGLGMSSSDVDVCLAPHSTSKIEKQDDLLAIKTLGFRGEALSSIAACSRIYLESARKEGDGRSITAENSKIVATQNTILSKVGTSVDVEELFFYLPARRRFLKKPHMEFTNCRNVFDDLALCHPEVSFKLTKDKKLETLYPVGTLKERLQQMWSEFVKADDIIEFENSMDHVSYQFIGTKPNVTRRDRRFIKIFVNGRRVEDSHLMQAILKSYEGILPGGFFPYATLHLSINPEMVDHNIHPSKKEVRFLHLPHLVGFLIKTIRLYFHENLQGLIPTLEAIEDIEILENLQGSLFTPNLISPVPNLQMPTGEAVPIYYPSDAPSPLAGIGSNILSPAVGAHEDTSNLWNVSTTFTLPSMTEDGEKEEKFTYLGQFATRYLVLEFQEKLVLIDQHAAHERILFEGFKAQAQEAEKLIFPYPFVLETAPLSTEQIQQYADIGVLIELAYEDLETPLWEYRLNGLPRLCPSMEPLIIDFIKAEANHVVTDLFFRLYSTLACRRAIKSGDTLTQDKSLELVSEIFTNKWFSCPHGRPLWLEFKKSYFDNLIKRT